MIAADHLPVPTSVGRAGNRLAPYFPGLVFEWLRSTPEDRVKELAGTIVMVDVSGFTKLSEGLAKHGKVGAEELTATIGSCFVTLLDLAAANGGQLLKFGGDALLLYFSGESHEARACRAAIEMRRALRVVGRLTVLGQKVSLRMSAGIHSGTFHFFLVGDSHREFLVVGPATSSVVEMEAAAGAGEIVVSSATARGVNPGLVGSEKGAGHLLRRSPAASRDSFGPEDVDPGLDLLGGIPVGLRDVLDGDHQDSEHRRVTVAFVHFDGTDALIEVDGATETARRLDVLVTDVQRAVDRQAVTFLATDVDRDGGKIILTAGAPSTSGDDESRMLLAAREIMDAGGPIALRIGVNQGAVFVGEVGPRYRRTFTVMGDAVNLSARLMAKAEPGQIITTPELVARSRSRFSTTELEPFFVKGKAKAVRALSVGARDQPVAAVAPDELSFVGRRHELQLLSGIAHDAAEGRGTLVEIIGEPGVGKSRLADRLREMTADRLQLAMVCERYDSSTPYHAVRGLLRDLLDLPAEGNEGDIAMHFLAAVESRLPELLPWAPLIGMAIDIPVPETKETGELEEEFRRPKLARVVIDMLAQLLPDQGLFVIEDAHVMDEASAELIAGLAAVVGATSWVWCMTRRDVDSGFVAADGLSTRIELLPLSPEEALGLAEEATQAAPLPPRDLAVLVDRSGGNPLFLRELIAAATNGEAVRALPDTIEDVIAARIDRLGNEDRHLLRRMSVLGQSFPSSLLAEVAGELPADDDPAWVRLEPFITRDGRGAVAFRNGLVRDCAYDGLSFRLRRELHARAGDTIQASAIERGEDQPELLSFHYLHAQRFDDAWAYSLQAAARAEAVYANSDAAEYYERALTAARRILRLTSRDLSDVHESLGDARNLTGDYFDAAVAYRAARRLVVDDPVAQARLILKLARVQGWLDRYTNALRWITKGLRVLDQSSGGDVVRQRAELAGWYGRFCQESGHHRRAITWCAQAVAEAEVADDRHVMADALRVIDWARMDLGQLEHPDNWERALALFEDLDDLPGQAGVLNMLGGFAYYKGDWDEAVTLYQRAQDTVRRTGNAVMDAFYVFNLGEIALDRGHLDEAARAFGRASRTWRAAGYRSGAADADGKLGRVAAGQQRFDDAIDLYMSAMEEFRDIGSQSDALEVQARLAECWLLSGDSEAALATVAQALTTAQTLGGVASQIPLLHRIRGSALAVNGRIDEAGEALRQSLDAAHTRGAEYEAALTMRVLAEVETDATERRDELRRSAAATLAQLHVTWTPEYPAGPSTAS